MGYDFKNMPSTGLMAKELGVDRKTLTKWAKKGIIPSYVNPANGYRYFDRTKTLRALKLQGLDFSGPIDEKSVI